MTTNYREIMRLESLGAQQERHRQCGTMCTQYGVDNARKSKSLWPAVAAARRHV